ncbi:MAG TPA: DUF6600 domain-containing protein [Candidatus Cybelea sp.]|nr:DUF6600 domain-containing protein [Candidatus Cybelea sp.]
MSCSFSRCSRPFAGALALALVLSVACLPALAEPDAAQDAKDPPTAIGRIALISGNATYRSDDSGAWSSAVMNYPLTDGNAVSTEPRSHAAIDLGAGRLYLDAASTLRIDTLSDGKAALSLQSGAAILHLLPGGEGQVFEIATLRGTARIDQPGYYEIVAGDEKYASVAAALEGGAQFKSSDGAELALGPGQRATVAPGATKPALDAAGEDDLIKLVAGEVQESGENASEAPKYVSARATGFQDLEHNGLWELTTEYGPVWEPQVTSEWAPYRKGHWAEIAPWGPTWIDDAPWGFAPFHYGRWVQVSDRWAWVPGDASKAPVYAPAVVSFFGTAGDKGGSKVGWVPLGPEEPYFPPYPVTINYVRVVNEPDVPKIVNVTNVTNVTQVTNVVREVDRRPVLVIGRLINRHAATMGGGSLNFHSGGVSVSVGNGPMFQSETPLNDVTSPGLVTVGPVPALNAPAIPPKATPAPSMLAPNRSSGEVPVTPSRSVSAAATPAMRFQPALVLTKPGALPPQFQNVPKVAASHPSLETPLASPYQPQGQPLGQSLGQPLVIWKTNPPVSTTTGAVQTPSPSPASGPTPAPNKTTTTANSSSPPMGMPSTGGTGLGGPSKPVFQHCIPTVGIACMVGP